MEGTLQSSTQRIPVPFCVKMQPFTGSSFFFSLSLSLSPSEFCRECTLTQSVSHTGVFLRRRRRRWFRSRCPLAISRAQATHGEVWDVSWGRSSSFDQPFFRKWQFWQIHLNLEKIVEHSLSFSVSIIGLAESGGGGECVDDGCCSGGGGGREFFVLPD